MARARLASAAEITAFAFVASVGVASATAAAPASPHPSSPHVAIIEDIYVVTSEEIGTAAELNDFILSDTPKTIQVEASTGEITEVREGASFDRAVSDDTPSNEQKFPHLP